MNGAGRRTGQAAGPDDSAPAGPDGNIPSGAEPGGAEPGGAELALSEHAEKRRRRLAEAFGQALPDSTTDDTGAGWGERGGTGRDDDWYRREVPPHHG